MKAFVVNIQNDIGPFLYIGRPRTGKLWRFGNPFAIGPDGTRALVIKKFRHWLLDGNSFRNVEATEKRRVWILNNLHKLSGQKLGCFCKPLECHGDVLLEVMERNSVSP